MAYENEIAFAAVRLTIRSTIGLRRTDDHVVVAVAIDIANDADGFAAFVIVVYTEEGRPLGRSQRC